MKVKSFFDKDTATVTYVVVDETTNTCAVIDSVLDYDMNSGKTCTASADRVVDYVTSQKLSVEWILETHAHADHLSAAVYIKKKLGGKIAIGEHIKEVIHFWVDIFNTSKDTKLDGSQFTHLFKDGEIFKIGSIEVKVMHTPGHTPACVCYLMEDSIFVGDTIFMPYVGTARTDFPGGSARSLYKSIQKILALPEDTKTYTCHDYPPTGQDPAWISTVGEQRKKNIMVGGGIQEDEFVSMRNKKDEGKAVPRLLLPSIQVNIRAGQFGDCETNGTHYIKIPVDKL